MTTPGASRREWKVKHATSLERLEEVLNAVSPLGWTVHTITDAGPKDGFYYTIILWRETPTSEPDR